MPRLTADSKMKNGVRYLRLEPLEQRLLLASLWQNPVLPLDVDDSGQVTPADVVLVINDLNQSGARPVPADSSTDAAPPYLDVSGDGWISPADALRVVNALNKPNPPLVLTAHLSPESDPNGNGVVLSSQVTLRGQTLPGLAVRAAAVAHDLAGEETLNVAALEAETAVETVAGKDGRFQVTITLPAAISKIRVEARNYLGHSVAVERLVRQGDVITDWNASLLNIVRDWTTISDDPYERRIVPSEPPRVAHHLAMVHTAMYDAVNAITGTHEPYHFEDSASGEVSIVAAAAAAAHRVASELYAEHDERAVWDASLAEALATVPAGDAKEAGISLGYEAGDAILALRAQDGSTETQSRYTPGEEPGDWQRTLPGNLPPLLPHWPNVTPFALDRGDQFRPAPPPALDSTEYAAAVDEVMQLGRFDSTTRTEEQTEIAIFWVDGGGTFTPPGHWNQIAADVAIFQGRTLAENARLFSLLNLALADAGIAAWDAKYAYDLWRPIDAIRHAGLDGNPTTAPDPNWLPLVVTPPFPSYTSGHSTFSGAADAVLSALLGSDVTFSSQADGHSGFTQRPLDTGKVITRRFTSFREAADEVGRSRVYGGIHFNFDDIAGLESGRAIGFFVVERFLRPR